jgi:hypothetical protein
MIVQDEKKSFFLSFFMSGRNKCENKFICFCYDSNKYKRRISSIKVLRAPSSIGFIISNSQQKIIKCWNEVFRCAVALKSCIATK